MPLRAPIDSKMLVPVPIPRAKGVHVMWLLIIILLLLLLAGGGVFVLEGVLRLILIVLLVVLIVGVIFGRGRIRM